jgi:hypothetical protein
MKDGQDTIGHGYSSNLYRSSVRLFPTTLARLSWDRPAPACPRRRTSILKRLPRMVNGINVLI